MQILQKVASLFQFSQNDLVFSEVLGYSKFDTRTIILHLSLYSLSFAGLKISSSKEKVTD